MPPVFDDPVAERRGRRPQQHNGGQQPRSGASGSRSPRTPDLTIFAPNRASSSFAPNRIPHSARKKQKHFPMSKGLIWLMFHPLQVRQGPMEN
jgi:hypothetical protein